ncbi:small subunit ribosomal protein S16 [Limimonas halophila]|uniref:Small ribosomal subunit protein bS16 n=1 Tax=Limimonas halophila TaxID=1082479 RepID=A0A1G7R9F5_9PROT|nr:30S ribosomal protein S16 [Limimonas halophila]SDG06610.1 small subunit ribosomal protein S16 [Limimonas halophila]
MALAIRLMRKGAKKRPFYRIVVAEKDAPRDGRFVDQIGFYNPMVPPDHPERYKIHSERATQWLNNGAKPTDRVHRLLEKEELITPRSIPQQTRNHIPKAERPRKGRGTGRSGSRA